MILIIEDEKDVAQIIYETLTFSKEFRQIDSNVIKVQSPLSALDLINNNEVTLIITDLVLPGMSGIDFIKAVKNKSDVPIICASGAIEDYEEELSGIKGVYIFSKPFKTQTLKEVCTAVLSTKHKRTA